MTPEREPETPRREAVRLIGLTFARIVAARDNPDEVWRLAKRGHLTVDKLAKELDQEDRCQSTI
jgi:hypothetical protein